MKVLVDYPTAREEVEIVHRMSVDRPDPQQVLTSDELLALQAAADDVFVHEAVVDYAVRLVLATREPAQHDLPDLEPLIAHGASPRATLGLVAASRALALMRGRDYVLPQEVYDVAGDILRHRVILSYEALADGIVAEDVVNRVLRTVIAPRVAPGQDGDYGDGLGVGSSAS
jgi:MoxR-like ATPase